MLSVYVACNSIKLVSSWNMLLMLKTNISTTVYSQSQTKQQGRFLSVIKCKNDCLAVQLAFKPDIGSLIGFLFRKKEDFLAVPQNGTLLFYGQLFSQISSIVLHI